LNRKMFEAMMHAEPENPDRRYVFIVDNENLAMFIFLAGFSAVLLQQEQDEYYFDAEGLVDYLRSLELRGTNRMDYLYVPACSTKKQNDLLTEYFKEQYLEYREGWRLFKDKDYLTRLDADQEVKKIVRQFVDRYEKKPDEEPDLDRYHMLDKDGKPTSPMDIAIVEQIMESVAFFFLGSTPYLYENGVYTEDYGGAKTQGRDPKTALPEIYAQQYHQSDLRAVDLAAGSAEEVLSAVQLSGTLGQFPERLLRSD